MHALQRYVRLQLWSHQDTAFENDGLGWHRLTDFATRSLCAPGCCGYGSFIVCGKDVETYVLFGRCCGVYERHLSGLCSQTSPFVQEDPAGRRSLSCVRVVVTSSLLRLDPLDRDLASSQGGR